MTSMPRASVRRPAHPAIRDQIFGFARQHRTLSPSEWREGLDSLCREAEGCGYLVTVGLARAFQLELDSAPSRNCTGVFLIYMAGALSLEPCNDPDILNLLLKGIRRRLNETQRRLDADRSPPSLRQADRQPTTAPAAAPPPQHTGSAQESMSGKTIECTQAAGHFAPERTTTSSCEPPKASRQPF